MFRWFVRRWWEIKIIWKEIFSKRIWSFISSIHSFFKFCHGRCKISIHDWWIFYFFAVFFFWNNYYQTLIYINSISLKIFEKFSSTIFRISLMYIIQNYILKEIRKFEMHTHTYGQSWKISRRLHGRLSTEFQVKVGALGLWTWNWIINSAWRWETRTTRRVSAQPDAIRLKTLNRGTLSKRWLPIARGRQVETKGASRRK